MARPALALFGKLVTVQAGHYRRALAGHVYQDRGDGPAVFGPIVDARQHDDACHGIAAEGERHQHGDGRRGAKAGQDADGHAGRKAEKAEQQVRRGQRRGEPLEQTAEIHSPLLNAERTGWQHHPDAKDKDQIAGTDDHNRAENGFAPAVALHDFQADADEQKQRDEEADYGNDQNGREEDGK